MDILLISGMAWTSISTLFIINEVRWSHHMPPPHFTWYLSTLCYPILSYLVSSHPSLFFLISSYLLLIIYLVKFVWSIISLQYSHDWLLFHQPMIWKPKRNKKLNQRHWNQVWNPIQVWKKVYGLMRKGMKSNRYGAYNVTWCQPCDVRSCHVMSCDMMWCDVMRCDMMWYDVMSVDLIFCHLSCVKC